MKSRMILPLLPLVMAIMMFAGSSDAKAIDIGVSLGGIVGSEACRIEPRLRACLFMDAPMPVEVVKSGLRQPALWITRDAETMRLERRRSGGWSEAEISAHQTRRPSPPRGSPNGRPATTRSGLSSVWTGARA